MSKLPRERMRTASVCSFLFASFCVTSSVAGCSSSSSSGSDGSGGSTSSTGSTQATLADRSFALQSIPTAVATDSVTFTTSAEVQSLQVGDVIASGTMASAPYLRTITAVTVDSPVAGSTTFATTGASLDQLFATADLDQSLAVTAGDPNAVAPLSLNPLDFSALPEGGKEWKLGDEGSKGVIGLGGNGSVDFSESNFRLSGGIDFQYTKRGVIDIRPEHMRLVLNGGISVTVGAKMTASAALDYMSPEVPYGEYPLGTIVVTAGPVPIPIAISLEFSGNTTTKLDGAVNIHEAVTGAFQLQAGMDYTSAGGVTGVGSHKELINHAPFTVSGDASGSFHLNPLNATVKFLVFDAAGPEIELQPYIGAKAQTNEEGGPSLLGQYGITGRLGGELTVLGHELGEVSVTLFDASGTFASCSATALTCSAGPVVEGSE